MSELESCLEAARLLKHGNEAQNSKSSRPSRRKHDPPAQLSSPPPKAAPALIAKQGPPAQATDESKPSSVCFDSIELPKT